MKDYFLNTSDGTSSWQRVRVENLEEAKLECLRRFRPMKNNTVLMIAGGFNELNNANLISVRNAKIGSEWVDIPGVY